MSGEIDAAACSPPPFTNWQRWVLLAAFALLVALRLPGAWPHGRFVDEEATVFLAYAWHFPWYDALFRSFAGYLNLGATVSTVLAVALVRGDILPLERAPYLTMGFALAFQLLPALLVLYGRAPWLAGRLPVVAALLIIATAPATEEVFFNVLHIQFHLALCVALILSFDVPGSRRGQLGFCVLLFFAPLCGPGAIILLPLFCLRVVAERDRRRLPQLVALAAGAAVQLLLFFEPSPLRGHANDPVAIAAAIFVRLVALPLSGVGTANLSGQNIFRSMDSGGSLGFAAAGLSILLFGWLLIVAAKRGGGIVWLLLSALAIALASLGFGIVIVNPADLLNVMRGERYNFLPLVLLGLSMIALSKRSSGTVRLIYAWATALILVSGVIWYFRPSPEFAEGPSWRAEVLAWRADHDHPLAVWPRPWAADLSDHARPCSTPVVGRARLTDPRYCESGWVAGFFRPM